MEIEGNPKSNESANKYGNDINKNLNLFLSKHKSANKTTNERQMVGNNEQMHQKYLLEKINITFNE